MSRESITIRTSRKRGREEEGRDDFVIAERLVHALIFRGAEVAQEAIDWLRSHSDKGEAARVVQALAIFGGPAGAQTVTDWWLRHGDKDKAAGVAQALAMHGEPTGVQKAIDWWSRHGDKDKAAGVAQALAKHGGLTGVQKAIDWLRNHGGADGAGEVAESLAEHGRLAGVQAATDWLRNHGGADGVDGVAESLAKHGGRVGMQAAFSWLHRDEPLEWFDIQEVLAIYGGRNDLQPAMNDMDDKWLEPLAVKRDAFWLSAGGDKSDANFEAVLEARGGASALRDGITKRSDEVGCGNAVMSLLYVLAKYCGAHGAAAVAGFIRLCGGAGTEVILRGTYCNGAAGDQYAAALAAADWLERSGHADKIIKGHERIASDAPDHKSAVVAAATSEASADAATNTVKMAAAAAAAAADIAVNRDQCLRVVSNAFMRAAAANAAVEVDALVDALVPGARMTVAPSAAVPEPAGGAQSDAGNAVANALIVGATHADPAAAAPNANATEDVTMSPVSGAQEVTQAMETLQPDAVAVDVPCSSSNTDAGSSVGSSTNAASGGVSSESATSDLPGSGDARHKASSRLSGITHRLRASDSDDHKNPYSYAYGHKEHGMSSIDFLLQTYGSEWLKGWLDTLQHAMKSLHYPLSFTIARTLDELPQGRGLLDQNGGLFESSRHDVQGGSTVPDTLRVLGEPDVSGTPKSICSIHQAMSTTNQQSSSTTLLQEVAAMFAGSGSVAVMAAVDGSGPLVVDSFSLDAEFSADVYPRGVIGNNGSTLVGAEA